MPSIFRLCVQDKVFLASEAKKSVQNCIQNLLGPDILYLIIFEGCKAPSKNKKLIEMAYTTFLTDIIKHADFNQVEHRFLVDEGEYSRLLMNQLYLGTKEGPRIKQACIENLKALHMKLEDARENRDLNDDYGGSSFLGTLEDVLKRAFMSKQNPSTIYEEGSGNSNEQ